MDSVFIDRVPKAIIFDWDGVLVQSLGFIKKAFCHALHHISPLLEIDVENLPALSLKNYFPQIFGDRAPEAERFFYDYVMTHHLQALEPTEGAAELLEFLHQSSYPLFVISNKKGEVLRKEVDYLSWKGYFNGVLGAGDCEEDKPSPLPVRSVLQAIGMLPSRKVWFVGDSLVDMECAVRSGCFSVLMDAEKKFLNNKEILADVRISSLEDLKGRVIHNKV